MKKILFVCMGNICRSPAAEGIMKNFLEEEKYNEVIEVDSAGTIGYHEGEPADSRMKMHCSKRGYKLTSLSRKFNSTLDFEKFDYIVTMDDDNYKNVLALDNSNQYRNRIFKMADFIKDSGYSEIPDPYYGGEKGFELVIDLLEQGNKNLLKKIKTDIE